MIFNEEIKNLSKQFDIDEITVLREYLEVLFLSNLYSFKESSKIFFKGGTSLRLLLNSFRFSEDLDFTSSLEDDKLKSVIEKTYKKIKNFIIDINLKEIEKKRDSMITYLNYQDKNMKFPLNINIEFSIREKPLTMKETILTTPYPIVPYPLIIHLDWEEILAEKIRALLKREKGRDLFDIWFLLSKNIKINMDIVNKKMKYYKEKIDLKDIIDKIKNFDEKNLILDLNKFLPRTHRKILKDLKNLTLDEITKSI
ncbi:MAG: nucleotidyl transferase AbiEii/AbiGii toxin family protein [Caldisericia bacterium]